jgi:single-strand DNA-binding protein
MKEEELTSINRVVLVGNLTKDPEMRATKDTTVCRLRVACNGSQRDPESGAWREKPNYFDVSVFGGSAESCGRFLSKGRPVAIDGRLDWHEWQTAEGHRRQAVAIIAEHVQFLSSRQTQDTQEENGSEPMAVAVAAEASEGGEGDLAF